MVKAIEAVAQKERENVSAETFLPALDELAPDVDASTAVTLWRGENCDYSMAVEALLSRAGA